jgi:hypothetical protein
MIEMRNQLKHTNIPIRDLHTCLISTNFAFANPIAVGPLVLAGLAVSENNDEEGRKKKQKKQKQNNNNNNNKRTDLSFGFDCGR